MFYPIKALKTTKVSLGDCATFPDLNTNDVKM